MRKRFIGLMLIAVMASSVTACSFDFSKDKEEEEEDDDKKSKRKDKDKERDAAEATEEPVEEASDSSDYLYLYDDTCYVIDTSGKETASYDIKGLRGIIPGDDGFYDPYFREYGDGLLIYYSSNYDSNGTTTTFYALDPVEKDYCVLYTTDTDWYLDRIDYYDGKLFIDLSNNGMHDEKVFVRDGDAVGFLADESKYSDLINSLEDYNSFCGGVDFTDGCYGSYDCSFTRAFESAGYLIGRNEDGFFKVTPDGTSKKLDGLPDSNIMIEAYDSDQIIYGQYDDDYKNYSLNVYDLNSGKVVTPDLGDKRNNFLAFYDNELIYYTSGDQKDYGIQNYTVCSYNCDSGDLREIYSESTVPGTGITPAIEGFRIIGGRMYYQKLMDKTVNWVSVDVKNGYSDFADTGLAVNDDHTFYYGNVTYRSGEVFCPNCGIPLEQYYLEKFVLDDSNKNADKINEKLDEMFADRVSYCAYFPIDTDTDMCEYHQEYPEQYCEVFENRVSDAGLIGKGYLYINYDGYWYGGGAHGYPSRDQDLFDLSTGEKVTMADLYPGTEEELKELIAKKTREDYNSYDVNDSPYFADDPDEIYNKAYDSASIDSSNFDFTEDGVYYYYYPYDMGSYAAGFIDILLTYDELGFELK